MIASTPRRRLDELVRRGFARVLCEGGPGLLAQPVEADVLDDLCRTLSPPFAAPQPLSLNRGTPSPLREMTLSHALNRDGFLYLRYPPRRRR